MALNLVTENNSSYDPYLKWNGKAGRFFVKGETGDDKEVTPEQFILDLENIKTGWMFFAAGQAPDRVWDSSLTQPAPKPSENHKRGFSVRLYSKKLGGVFELSGNSMHLCSAINELYNSFDVQKAANAGQVPVVKFTGCQTMKDKMGTNYKPTFVLEKFVARPAELDATPATKANAPVTQSAPVAAQVDYNEF
jgi:hypothetical protein